MKKTKNILTFLLITTLVFSQERPVHTYSIVAIDKESGQMGGAVQSHWFSVGSLVLWADPGVGIVATQSFVRPEYGPELLNMFSRGVSPQLALNMLLKKDSEQNVRQIGAVDTKGRSVTFTGKDCIIYASGLQGDGYAIQANIMANPGVPEAMEKAYLSTEGSLADKLYAALVAAENIGGDLRGKQSAAMLVVPLDRVDNLLSSKIYDIRVDDSPDPLSDLDRLMRIQKAYIFANEGDVLAAEGKLQEALDAYNKASELYPENVELLFWGAVILCTDDKFDIAKPMFEKIFKADPDLREMIPRLENHPMFPLSKDMVKKILDIAQKKANNKSLGEVSNNFKQVSGIGYTDMTSADIRSLKNYHIYKDLNYDDAWTYPKEESYIKYINRIVSVENPFKKGEPMNADIQGYALNEKGERYTLPFRDLDTGTTTNEYRMAFPADYLKSLGMTDSDLSHMIEKPHEFLRRLQVNNAQDNKGQYK